MRYAALRKPALAFLALAVLTGGVLISRIGGATVAAQEGPAAASSAQSELDTVLTSKTGKFVYDPNWRTKLSAQCNVIGELKDCLGATIVKIGTDDTDWTGWTQLNGKWIRAFGELTLLPSECGVHLYVLSPAENVRAVTDPCQSDTKATATPSGGGGGGGGTTTRECTGSTVTSVYNIRTGSDDVVWSRQRGLESSGQILSLGGNQLYDPIVGLRYQGVAIPRNAKIFSARVKFSPAASSGIDVNQRIFGVNRGTAPSWGSSSPGSAPRTTANVLWEITNQWTGSTGCGSINTNNVGAPIQEVVDRTDWSSGNALALLFEWEGPFAETSQRPVKSLEGGCPPQLTVSWCPASITTGPTSTASSPKGTGTPGSVIPSTTPSSTQRATPTGTLATATLDPEKTKTVVPTATKTLDPGGTLPSATPTNTTGPVVPSATPTATAGGGSVDPSPTPCNNPLDLNGDGVIDLLDIDIIILAFGSVPGSPNWNPVADVNHDGRVDLLDYLIVRENFGPACPPKLTPPPGA